MRWASAGKIPVLEIMSRVLQNIAAMLAACIIIEIETKDEGGEESSEVKNYAAG